MPKSASRSKAVPKPNSAHITPTSEERDRGVDWNRLGEILRRPARDNVQELEEIAGKLMDAWCFVKPWEQPDQAKFALASKLVRFLESPKHYGNDRGLDGPVKVLSFGQKVLAAAMRETDPDKLSAMVHRSLRPGNERGLRKDVDVEFEITSDRGKEKYGDTLLFGIAGNEHAYTATLFRIFAARYDATRLRAADALEKRDWALTHRERAILPRRIQEELENRLEEQKARYRSHVTAEKAAPLEIDVERVLDGMELPLLGIADRDTIRKNTHLLRADARPLIAPKSATKLRAEGAQKANPA